MVYSTYDSPDHHYQQQGVEVQDGVALTHVNLSILMMDVSVIVGIMLGSMPMIIERDTTLSSPPCHMPVPVSRTQKRLVGTKRKLP